MNTSRVLSALVGFLMVLVLALPLAADAENGTVEYSREQLAQMLAPVALYPDALLSQVLMAATYPLEVVEADRWVRRNPLLTGANLDEALLDQDWDASVKELCHVPTVLSLMSERLDETTNLGNAFLAQEGEVMEIVQELRSRAYREGNLRSNDKQKVIVQADGVIVIAPAEPQTVYVPYYNTRYVYGPWWYPGWPPWYWGPGDLAIGSSIYFWPDVYFGFGFGFGYWSRFDWPRRTIVISVQRRPRFIRHDDNWQARRGSWRHEPRHRRGVSYRDRPTAEKFGQFRERDREFNREVRGFPERERAGRTTPESQREQAVRGPVAASGGIVPVPATRADRGERARAPERQRAKPENKIGVTPGARTRSEREDKVVNRPETGDRPETWRMPEGRPESTGNSAPVIRRVEPRLQAGRENIRLRETPTVRERTTIFSGDGNAREETRSSIRGRGSRDSMRRSEPERGAERTRDRGEDRSGDRGRFRR